MIMVGAGDANMKRSFCEVKPWSEVSEVTDLQRFDAGIMPLPDDPWKRGKCGYKLIQYMACGIPVVASPVGVNKEIVDHGVNGFLAETTTEWIEALRILRDNPDLRRRMGAAGRRKVEQRYCLQVTAPRLHKLILSLVG
jgi:glycosyltransferase involved in cell wall biosynthesis